MLTVYFPVFTGSSADRKMKLRNGKFTYAEENKNQCDASPGTRGD